MLFQLFNFFFLKIPNEFLLDFFALLSYESCYSQYIENVENKDLYWEIFYERCNIYVSNASPTIPNQRTVQTSKAIIVFFFWRKGLKAIIVPGPNDEK